MRQVNLQNRWDYLGSRYIFHGGIALLDERREGGQTSHSAHHAPLPYPLYTIGQTTHRYEAYMKHAFVIDPTHGTNVALMASGTLHRYDAHYGAKEYRLDEKNGYAQLMLETTRAEVHNLSAGLSLHHDHLGADDHETTPGAYLQYTLSPGTRLTLMAGLRADHSSRYGWFVTPRIHFKYIPHEVLTLRLSAGKGYRTPHALAEHNYLLASGRQLVADARQQEEAWNYGASAALTIPVDGKTLRLNAEYYYTHFVRQMLVDYDSDPRLIRLTDLNGRSRSHTLQIDASYPLLDGLELTAAYRLNDVKSTYGDRFMEKPLQSRYKGLVTIGWKPMMALWQVDVTLQLNGGGRMPEPYTKADGSLSWEREFPAYPQLNIQVTREFRHMSVYVGAENLTGYRQAVPVIEAGAPTSALFEPTMVYAGLRMHLWRL